MTTLGTCHFVPPYLLQRLAEAHDGADPEAAHRCHATLEVDDRLRTARLRPRSARPRTPVPADEATPGGAAAWTVHTAENTSRLPGTPVRSAGEPDSGDAAVDEAAYGIGGSLALFDEVYGRDSFDGQGAPVSLTVHYEQGYDNAFWDGTQLVFGDGDGRVFDRFTKPVDVLGHEFTHAVTEHTAGLAYQGQPGALNESVSDAFASCLKQRLLGQTALEGDWLIGAGIFLPGVQARALRDMAAPGTAYDDPTLGQDPQVGHLDDYVDTTDDNGGVHLNSGIPNRAFQLAATGIGGGSWEGAGRIWYAALTGGRVTAQTDFAGFAAATVAAAGPHAGTVREAWAQVGVEVPVEPGAAVPVGAGAPAAGSDSSSGAGDGSGSGDSGGSGGGWGGGPRGRVAVRRTGGFAGLVATGEMELDDDPRSEEVRSLVARIDPRSVTGGDPRPDHFVYDFELADRGRTVVPEQHLTPDLRRLADLLLDPGAVENSG